MLDQFVREERIDSSRIRPGRPGWLRGIVPPVVTPMHADGRVDEVGLERQLRRLLDAGVHGLFVLGTSGEGAYLTNADRRRVLEVTVSVVGDRVPVLVGAMSPSPRQIAEVGEMCADLLIDALVCTTPFYGAGHPREVTDHFRAVADVVDLPVVAYNIPGATGTLLTTAMIVELANEGVIAGIKDSGGDEFALRRTVLACAELEGFPVMSGSEVMVDSALRLGVDGAVPGLGNVSPRPYVELFDAAQAGDFGRAQEIQERLIELFGMASIANGSRMGNFSAGIGSFKAALVALGVIGNRATTAPLVPLDDREAALVAEHLEKFDIERIC